MSEEPQFSFSIPPPAEEKSPSPSASASASVSVSALSRSQSPLPSQPPLPSSTSASFELKKYKTLKYIQTQAKSLKTTFHSQNIIKIAFLKSHILLREPSVPSTLSLPTTLLNLQCVDIELKKFQPTYSALIQNLSRFEEKGIDTYFKKMKEELDEHTAKEMREDARFKREIQLRIGMLLKLEGYMRGLEEDMERVGEELKGKIRGYKDMMKNMYDSVSMAVNSSQLSNGKEERGRHADSSRQRRKEREREREREREAEVSPYKKHGIQDLITDHHNYEISQSNYSENHYKTLQQHTTDFQRSTVVEGFGQKQVASLNGRNKPLEDRRSSLNMEKSGMNQREQRQLQGRPEESGRGRVREETRFTRPRLSPQIQKPK